MSSGERWRVWLSRLASGVFALSVATMLVVGIAALAAGSDELTSHTLSASDAGRIVFVDRVGTPLGEAHPPPVGAVASQREVPSALIDTLVANRHFDRGDGEEAVRRLRWVLTGDRDKIVSGAARSYVEATGELRAVERGGWSGVMGRLRHVLTVARAEVALASREEVVSYLNVASFGHRTRGVGAAAQTYFGVPVGQLTDQQAVYLAERLLAANGPTASAASLTASNWTVFAATGDPALDATIEPTLRWLTSWLTTRYGEGSLARSEVEVTLTLDAQAQRLAHGLAAEGAAQVGVLVADDTAGVRVLLGEPTGGMCGPTRASDDASCLRPVLAVADTTGPQPTIIERWSTPTQRRDGSTDDWASLAQSSMTGASLGAADTDFARSDRLVVVVAGGPSALAQRLLVELTHQLYPSATPDT